MTTIKKFKNNLSKVINVKLMIELCYLNITFFILLYLFDHLPLPMFETYSGSLHPFKDIAILTCLGISIIGTGCFFKSKWEDVQLSNLKPFAILIAAILVWFTTFSDYNYYFNSSFLGLRILCFISFILIFYRPSFIILFLLLCKIYLHQFNFPLGFIPVTDKKILWEFLLLVFGFISLKKYRLVKNENVVLISILALHFSNYLVPGVYKLLLGHKLGDYLFHNKIPNIFVTANQAGWLSGIDEILVSKTFKLLSNFSIPIAIIAVFTQIFPFFAIISNRLIKISLFLFEGMHIAIFSLSGIFFWKWIIFNILLLTFFFKKINFSIKEKVALGLMTILACILFNPVVLAWWDTPLGWTYTAKINGNKTNKDFFSPYDVLFAQGRLHFLHENKTLTGTYGTVRLNDFANELVYKEPSIEGVKKLLEKSGKIVKNNNLQNQIDIFFERYTKSFNEIPAWKCKVFRVVSPPYSIYFTDSFHSCGEKIKTISLEFSQFLNTEDELKILRNETVFEKTY